MDVIPFVEGLSDNQKRKAQAGDNLVDEDGANLVPSGLVLDTLFDANTILKADSDDTPAALTVAEQRLVGRITAGVITALTATQVRTLINVEDGSTADQSDAEIKTAYENNADTNEFSDAIASKAAGVEPLADVTDATNVAAAGAVMDGDFAGGSEGFARKLGTGSFFTHQSNLSASVAPTTGDDSDAGYSVASLWADNTADKIYMCIDSTVGAAVWKHLSTDATFTSGVQGLAPASGGGTANFLRADGTFAAPPGGAGGGSFVEVEFAYQASGASLTITVPANTLTIDGEHLFVEAVFESSGTDTPQLKWDGAVFSNSAAGTSSSEHKLSGWIHRTGATAQMIYCEGNESVDETLSVKFSTDAATLSGAVDIVADWDGGGNVVRSLKIWKVGI